MMDGIWAAGGTPLEISSIAIILNYLNKKINIDKNFSNTAVIQSIKIND